VYKHGLNEISICLVMQFEKPGRRDDFDYPDMAKEASTAALKDAGVSYKDIEQVTVGYCYGKALHVVVVLSVSQSYFLLATSCSQPVSSEVCSW